MRECLAKLAGQCKLVARKFSEDVHSNAEDVLPMLKIVKNSIAAYALLATGAWAWISCAAGPFVTNHLVATAPVRSGLVLGSSPARRDGGGPNHYFLYRIEAAAALYREGKVQFLIVSGDRRVDGYDEPSAMKDALIAKGVPAERIYRDAAGFHTRDSIARAHLLFGQEDAIVISQRFHAERAVFIARAHGLTFTGFAAQDVDAYFGVATYARETFSRYRRTHRCVDA